MTLAVQITAHILFISFLLHILSVDIDLPDWIITLTGSVFVICILTLNTLVRYI